jgi:CoA:oxalate CoA-transferase
VAQATGGLLAMTGFPDGPPVRAGGATADYVGGLYLALGVAVALLERERTGVARVVDLSNQDCVFAIADSAASIHAGIGAKMERVGNAHPFTSPYDCFATQDGYVVVGTASNKLFRKLCAGIGRPELGSDERFKNHRVRAANRPELTRILAGWMAERSCDGVLAALGPRGADVPCARVSSEVVFHGNALKLAGALPRERALAPELGEANAEVFGALGVSEAERAALKERGVI